MRSLTVGEVEIVALTDIEGPFFRLDQIFPGVRTEQWWLHKRRYPWAFADAHTLYGRVGSYLLRAPGHTLLVDTGIGPGTMGMRGKLLEDLEESGVGPEDVDTVFLTHLHGDHVGWSLAPDGGPAFPRARYVAQEAEWDAAEPQLRRAMAALDDLGALYLLDGEDVVETLGGERTRALADETASRAEAALAAIPADTSVLAEIVAGLAARTS